MIDIEIHLSETCNLNCSYCCHFAQLAEEEYLKPSDFEKDLAAISSDVLNNFGIMRLMGGEPLLNKDVKELICVARKYFRNKIELVTNGILLEKQDKELFRTCVENCVELRITRYPIPIPYYNISKRLRTEFPGLSIVDHREGNKFHHQKIDVSGSQDYEKNYGRCKIVQVMYCQQLVGTKLYVCPYSAHIRHFNKRFGYNLSDDEYLDLATVKDVSEVETWFGQPKKFCSYCDIDDTTLHPWAQYKKVNGEYVNEYE